MTREIAGNMARKLVQNSNTTHSVPVLAYGIEIILNGLIKFTALTTIGLLLGLLKEMYVMAFIFGSFRTISGGVHAHTFGRCFTISLGSFTLLALIVPSTTHWFLSNASVLYFFSTVIGSLLIFRFVPGVWEGRTYTPQRIRNSKWLALLFLFIILTFTWFAIHQPDSTWYELSWAALLGLYWQMFLVTPWGYRFIAILEGYKNH